VTGRQISRDDALMWLNDRLGREVYVVLLASNGDQVETVLTIPGRLGHWTEDPVWGRVRPGERADDLAGDYRVDGSRLDLTHLHVFGFEEGGDELMVILAPRDDEAENPAWLMIGVVEERPSLSGSES
jgi:hypothetical protein